MCSAPCGLSCPERWHRKPRANRPPSGEDPRGLHVCAGQALVVGQCPKVQDSRAELCCPQLHDLGHGANRANPEIPLREDGGCQSRASEGRSGRDEGWGPGPVRVLGTSTWERRTMQCLVRRERGQDSGHAGRCWTWAGPVPRLHVAFPSHPGAGGQGQGQDQIPVLAPSNERAAQRLLPWALVSPSVMVRQNHRGFQGCPTLWTLWATLEEEHVLGHTLNTLGRTITKSTLIMFT